MLVGGTQMKVSQPHTSNPTHIPSAAIPFLGLRRLLAILLGLLLLLLHVV